MAPFCLPAMLLLAAPTVEVVGDWSVRVTTDGGSYTFTVPTPSTVAIERERYDNLPVYQKAGGWNDGRALRGVNAQECSARTYLLPETLSAFDGPGPDAKPLVRGTDFDFNEDWGSLGRTAAWPADKPIYVTYQHVMGRIDSLVLAADGRPALRIGFPHQAVPEQPLLPPGEHRLANLWVGGRTPALRAANLLPLTESSYPEPAYDAATGAEALLPKTMAKLRNGEPLRILAWGDSVTDASYLPDPPTQRWQVQFVRRLRERFPKANIELVNLGWGGRSTDSFLGEPPGSEWNYAEKVLGAKADLIVSEFVNDAYMDPPTVETKYGKLLADFTAQGTEWIILTPHYVRGDWMGLDRESDIDQDPRPYVAGLRAFAAKHGVALADASLRWGRLWRQGIPYSTLLSNAINHPDPRGMAIFADALMAVFPAQ